MEKTINDVIKEIKENLKSPNVIFQYKEEDDL
jgi:hypothetical protein